MSTYDDLVEAGYDPHRQNERGYECRKCGHIPTEIELDQGFCRGCAEVRLAERKALVLW